MMVVPYISINATESRMTFICTMAEQIAYHSEFTQKECVEFCQKNNILVEPWSSLGRGNVLDQSSLEVDCCQPWQECSSGGHPLGNADRRFATRKVGYSKPNQGKIDVFNFERSQQEMLEMASLKAERIGADPDTCNF